MRYGLFLLIIAMFAKLDETQAQKFYIQNGLYGIAYNDGRILTDIKYDLAYTIYNESERNKVVFMKKNNKYGVVLFPNDTMPIVIEPKYDTIFHYYYRTQESYDEDFLFVKLNNKWGFITYNSYNKYSERGSSIKNKNTGISNVFISEMDYDSISYNSKLFKGNKQGYLFISTMSYLNGETYKEYCIIPAIYDKFIVENKSFETGIDTKRKYFRLYQVLKDGSVNYLSVESWSAKKSYRTHFPYIYKDEEISYAEEGLFLINQLGKPLLLYNAKDSTYKTINDNQGKGLVLNNYYNFEIIDYLGKGSLYEIYGRNDKKNEYIAIFSDINNNGVSISFNDTTGLSKLYKYKDKKYKAIYGFKLPSTIVNNIENELIRFTPFISKDILFVENNVLMQEYSLLTFPENKVVFQTTHKADDEYIVVYCPLSENMTCYPYFKIVKYINTHNKYEKVKQRTLGYINYKTYEFSKKRPKGCKKDSYWSVKQ